MTRCTDTTLSTSDRQLFRKISLTLVEGTRARRTHHQIGSKMQMASALDEGMLQCTQPSDFASVVTCGLQPLLQFGDSSSAHNPAAAMWVGSRSDDLFAWDERGWYP